MRIQIGKFKVIDSGIVFGNEKDPVDFIFEQAGKIDQLRFIFKVDKTDSKPSIKAEIWGDNGVQIVFKNFNDTSGYGTVEPLRFSMSDGTELLLQYNISSFPIGGKLIQYTLLTEEEVNDGK